MIDAPRAIAIFGGTGTGTVGGELRQSALASGYRVRALVRRPAAVGTAADNLGVVVGDVHDPDAAGRTLEGCAAVLSTLGARRGDDPGTRTAVTTNILDAMRRHQVRRLIVMGG